MEEQAGGRALGKGAEPREASQGAEQVRRHAVDSWKDRCVHRGESGVSRPTAAPYRKHEALPCLPCSDPSLRMSLGSLAVGGQC